MRMSDEETVTIAGDMYDGRQEAVDSFWEEICISGSDNFYTEPVDLGHVYEIKSKESCIFDNLFWDLFLDYPFDVLMVDTYRGSNAYKLEIHFTVEEDAIR